MPKRSLLILAAGRSSRMESSTPKALSLINGRSSIEIIVSQLHSAFDEVIIVCNETNLIEIRSHLEAHFPNLNLTFKIQKNLDGTFSGVRDGCNIDASTTVLIWCDQPMFKLPIISELINFFEEGFTDFLLPISKRKENYTQVVFDSNGNIEKILQARNGDIIDSGGFSDCGLFIFSRDVSKYLLSEHVKDLIAKHNNEISFLDLICIDEFKSIFNTKFYVIDSEYCRSFNTQKELKDLSCDKTF